MGRAFCRLSTDACRLDMRRLGMSQTPITADDADGFAISDVFAREILDSRGHPTIEGVTSEGQGPGSD